MEINKIHKSRIGEYFRTCTDDEIKNIDIALMRSLGIDQPEDLEDPEKDRLKAQYKEAITRAEEMEKRAIEAEEKAKTLTADLSKAETKVDVYKSLYDETLDKLLGAM